MAILKERKTWRREPKPKRARGSSLTPTEQENLALAIRFLFKRHGSWEVIAEATGFKSGTLATNNRRLLGPGLAIHVARFAGVNVDDILFGKWPPPNTCWTCGQHLPVPSDDKGEV